MITSLHFPCRDNSFCQIRVNQCLQFNGKQLVFFLHVWTGYGVMLFSHAHHTPYNVEYAHDPQALVFVNAAQARTTQE